MVWLIYVKIIYKHYIRAESATYGLQAASRHEGSAAFSGFPSVIVGSSSGSRCSPPVRVEKQWWQHQVLMPAFLSLTQAGSHRWTKVLRARSWPRNRNCNSERSLIDVLFEVLQRVRYSSFEELQDGWSVPCYVCLLCRMSLSSGILQPSTLPLPQQRERWWVAGQKVNEHSPVHLAVFRARKQESLNAFWYLVSWFKCVCLRGVL